MSLSDEDREALAELGRKPYPAWCDCGDSYCAIRRRIGSTVEQIVARHVAEALEAAADEIDEMVASSKSPVAGEDWHGFVIGYACSRTDAARIVRTAARGAR